MPKNNKTMTGLVSDHAQGFRVPLSSIMGYIKLIREDSSLSGNVLVHLSAIENASQQLLSLVTNLQTKARFDKNEFTLKPSTVSLEGLLNEVTQVATPMATTRGLKFTATITPHCARYVFLDKMRTKQMLINLIENSLNYTQEGFVSIRFDHVGKNLVFTLVDSGVVIQAAEIESFAVSHNNEVNDAVSALGLSLSITKSLIESMQGELEIESIPNEGSTITVKVPYRESEEHKTFLKTQPIPVQAIKSTLITRTVLLVENNLETSNFIAFLLKRGGYDVTVAEDWLLALAFLGELDFDVVMPNLEVTQLSGEAVIKKLREINFDKHVVAVSENISADQQKALIENGFSACLMKPIQMTELFAVIKRIAPAAG